MEPIPVGTTVDYTGSHRHGRYIVTEHQAPRPGIPDPETNYPDGVAYIIWPAGVEQRFGNRDQMITQVRRDSITPAGEMLSSPLSGADFTEGAGPDADCGCGERITYFNGGWMHIINPELRGTGDHDATPSP